MRKGRSIARYGVLAALNHKKAADRAKHHAPLSDPAAPGTRPRAIQFDTPFGHAEITHVNLNDGVVEGLRLLDVPAFTVQYHPEAAPGPHDATGLFAQFCALMEAAR